MKVIVNATPVIALALIDRLHLLKDMFDEVVIPAAVYDEVTIRGAGRPGAAKVAALDFLTIVRPDTPTGIDPRLFGLDAGETEVLLLASQIQPDWVIIDERLARRIALAMGLPLKGTIGLLLAAVQAGLIDKETALADAHQLTDHGIRISPALMTWLETELDKLP